jgi:hypothetical protein
MEVGSFDYVCNLMWFLLIKRSIKFGFKNLYGSLRNGGGGGRLPERKMQRYTIGGQFYPQFAGNLLPAETLGIRKHLLTLCRAKRSQKMEAIFNTY